MQDRSAPAPRLRPFHETGSACAAAICALLWPRSAPGRNRCRPMFVCSTASGSKIVSRKVSSRPRARNAWWMAGRESMAIEDPVPPHPTQEDAECSSYPFFWQVETHWFLLYQLPSGQEPTHGHAKRDEVGGRKRLCLGSFEFLEVADISRFRELLSRGLQHFPATDEMGERRVLVRRPPSSMPECMYSPRARVRCRDQTSPVVGFVFMQGARKRCVPGEGRLEDLNAAT